MSKPLHLDPSRDQYILAEAVEISSSHLYALPDGPLPKLVRIGDIDVAGQPLSIPEYRLKGIRQVHTVTLLEMIRNRKIRARSLVSQIDPVSLGGEIGVEDLRDYFLTRDGFISYCAELLIDAADTSTPSVTPVDDEAQPSNAVSVEGNGGVKTRRDVITPAIERAQSLSSNPLDVAEVWIHLCTLAHNKTQPMFGVTEDGIQYKKADDETAYLSKRSLGKRLARTRNKPR